MAEKARRTASAIVASIVLVALVVVHAPEGVGAGGQCGCRGAASAAGNVPAPLSGGASGIADPGTCTPGDEPGTADPDVWTIDRFVEVVAETSDTVVRAREALYVAKLSASLATPATGLTLTATGSWSNRENPTTRTKESQKVSVKAPITDKVNASTEYTIGDDSGTVKLTYSPFSGSTLSDIRGDFVGSAVGHVSASESAVDSVNMAELKLAESIESAWLSARRIYMDALRTIKSREAAEEEYRLAQVRLEIAERRHELGLAPESDVETAESNLLNAEITLLKARNDEQWLRRTLGEMTGEDMSNAEFVDLPEFSESIPEVGDLIASAMLKNSEILQAERDLESAERAMESAKNLLPELKLDVSADTKDWSPAVTFSASWSISLSRQYEVDKAVVALEQRKRLLEDTRKSLATEIEKSVSDLEIEIYSMEKWRRQLEAAEESYSCALESYDNGEALLVDVDAAALNLKKTRDSYLNSWGSVWSLWYSLVAKCHLE